MARNVPPKTPGQERDDEKRQALLSADPALIRAWARRWNIPLIETSDESLLRSIHQTRVLDTAMPQAARAISRRYLREHPE